MNQSSVTPGPAPSGVEGPQGGSSTMKWLLIVLVIVIVLGGGYWVYVKYGKTSATTATASPSPVAAITSSPSASAAISPSASSSVPADWKTYTNTQYSFSFKYPSNSTVKDIKSGNTDMPGIVALFAVGINNDWQDPFSVVEITSQSKDKEISWLKTWASYTAPNGSFSTTFSSTQEVTKYGKSATEVIFTNKPSGTTTFYVFSESGQTYVVDGDNPSNPAVGDQILPTFQFTK